MTLPTTFDGAMALLGRLLQDGNLWLGVQAFGVILALSAVLSYGLVQGMHR